jgi:flagellar protein FlaG
MDAQSLNPVNGAQSASTGAAAPTTSPAVPSSTSNAGGDDAATTRDPRTLQYQVDKSTNQVVTTIVDSANKTVVVQIPSEEVLRIAQAIDRMQGFFLEGKA